MTTERDDFYDGKLATHPLDGFFQGSAALLEEAENAALVAFYGAMPPSDNVEVSRVRSAARAALEVGLLGRDRKARADLLARWVEQTGEKP